MPIKRHPRFRQTRYSLSFLNLRLSRKRSKRTVPPRPKSVCPHTTRPKYRLQLISVNTSKLHHPRTAPPRILALPLPHPRTQLIPPPLPKHPTQSQIHLPHTPNPHLRNLLHTP